MGIADSLLQRFSWLELDHFSRYTSFNPSLLEFLQQQHGGTQQLAVSQSTDVRHKIGRTCSQPCHRLFTAQWKDYKLTRMPFGLEMTGYIGHFDKVPCCIVVVMTCQLFCVGTMERFQTIPNNRHSSMIKRFPKRVFKSRTQPADLYRSHVQLLIPGGCNWYWTN